MENQFKEILENLRKPIPFKWRVQSYSKKKPSASCVAYIDSRDVQDVLDKYCLWSDRYYCEDGKLFCEITIYADGREYKRSDTGSESQADAEKGHSSDAFKRAAVKFGVGRFLYSQPVKYLKASEVKTNSNYPYAVDGNGKKIYDITKHINSQLQPVQNTKQLPLLSQTQDGKTTRDWSRALATLRQGKTMAYLKSKFRISETDQAILLKQSKQSKTAA